MRYFIFFYSYTTTFKEGMGNFPVENFRIPARSLLLLWASEQSGIPPKNIAITNWIEFNNKEDFHNYFEK